MPQTGERTAFEEAREQFARELLPFPPLPECFTGRLLPFGDHVFTTRELDHGPYAMGVLVAEVLDGGPVPEYATIGFDGYGIQSWAVVTTSWCSGDWGLSLFLQFAWVRRPARRGYILRQRGLANRRPAHGRVLLRGCPPGRHRAGARPGKGTGG